MIRTILFSIFFMLTLSPYESVASPNSVDMQSIVSLQNRQKMIEEEKGSVIISPVSIHSTVSLAMFGATKESETRVQMMTGLKYPRDFSADSIAETNKAFNEEVTRINGLQTANKIYIMKNYSIKKSFQEIATEVFKSEAEVIDFIENQQAAETINQWVEDHTSNKIKEIFPTDVFSDNTKMALVNALYFKGIWKYQFDKEDTHKAPFFLTRENSVNVDIMRVTNHFEYGEIAELDAVSIALPYKDSETKMIIILPNNRTGLATLERKLGSMSIEQLSKKLTSKEVTVSIPKFRIEFNINLEIPLKKMGMSKMFSFEAEFDELVERSTSLRISKVVHEAFIEVNEEGVESAAATGFGIDVRSGIYAKPYVFKADHPFLFILSNHNEPLFIGRLNEF